MTRDRFSWLDLIVITILQAAVWAVIDWLHRS